MGLASLKYICTLIPNLFELTLNNITFHAGITDEGVKMSP